MVQSKKRPRLNSGGIVPRRYKVQILVINLDIDEKMKEVEKEGEGEDDQEKKDDNSRRLTSFPRSLHNPPQ